MFESLSERLGGVFDRLTRAGALTEADVVTALREVRVALLEADVSLATVQDAPRLPRVAVSSSSVSEFSQ